MTDAHLNGAPAFDLSRVERTIGREPLYRHRPRYGLLVFGPEATLRVWVVVDGVTLYMDRDGDGNLTGANERFSTIDTCHHVQLVDPTGEARYVIACNGDVQWDDGPKPQLKVDANGRPLLTAFRVHAEIHEPASYSQIAELKLADTPGDAPIAHIHVPLAFKLPNPAFVAMDVPYNFAVQVGTMNEAVGCLVVVRSDVGGMINLPAELLPVVDIEFPPKHLGSLPVKKRYTLDQRC